MLESTGRSGNALFISHNAVDRPYPVALETAIHELLDSAFGLAGIEDWQSYVTQDPRFYRPAEVDLLIGDASKARKVLGWKPRVGFQELVRMMYENDLSAEQAKHARG